jgi:hypothetical protein
MDPSTNSEGELAPEVGVPDLVALCRLLNEAGVQYMVYGGLACLLHGHERMTRDADLFVGPDRDNIARILAVLSRWGQGYAAELTVEDVVENVVVRIADTFVLDIAAEVWKLDWPGAWSRRRIAVVDGVEIPFLARSDLIRSKETYREKDRWDAEVLQAMNGPESGHAAAVQIETH